METGRASPEVIRNLPQNVALLKRGILRKAPQLDLLVVFRNRLMFSNTNLLLAFFLESMLTINLILDHLVQFAVGTMIDFTVSEG